MLLLQSSKDKRFITFIQDAISEAESQGGLSSILEHMGGIINTGDEEQRQKLLYKWSKPDYNVLLW